MGELVGTARGVFLCEFALVSLGLLLSGCFDSRAISEGNSGAGGSSGIAGSSGFAGTNAFPVRTGCEAGQFVRKAATSTRDVECGACLSGSYSLGGSVEVCTEWSNCPVGYQVTLEPSATQDRRCEPCPSGTFGTAINQSVCQAAEDCPEEASRAHLDQLQQRFVKFAQAAVSTAQEARPQLKPVQRTLGMMTVLLRQPACHKDLALLVSASLAQEVQQQIIVAKLVQPALSLQ